jgi:AraC-like DNA-binding protein
LPGHELSEGAVDTQVEMSSRKRSISSARLKNVISEVIRLGDPTLPSAAARLGISRRSLQRHLEIQELTYSDLVDEVRYEIARSLLATTELDVAEIGATLGYRDPSSFSRAFMRWAGVSPREYRGAGAAVQEAAPIGGPPAHG